MAGVGLDCAESLALASNRARLPREVRADRAPSTSTGGTQEMSSAASYVQEQRVESRAGPKRVEPVEQGDEQPGPFRAHACVTEAVEVLALVMAPKLEGGRRHGDDRAPAAQAAAIARPSIQERARPGLAPARRTHDRPACWRSGPRGKSSQLVLERVHRAVPRVVGLDVAAARLAEARVGLGILPLRLEVPPNVLGHRLGGQAAEDQRGREREEDLRRRPDRRPEHGRATREWLDRHDAEALELARGVDEDVRGLAVEWQGVVRIVPEGWPLLPKATAF